MKSSSLIDISSDAMASSHFELSNFTSIKTLAESLGLINSIPPQYAYHNSDPTNLASNDSLGASIPIIDYSLLSSGNPGERQSVIHNLGTACRDWGFFMVVNHGVPESVLKEIMEVTDEFFNLPEEEKMEYKTKHVLDPIRYGTSVNASKDQSLFWRDYLKVLVHPQFSSPRHPKHFSTILQDYCERTRELAGKLLGGISESLDLEQNHIQKTLELDSSLQIFAANLYPPCPQPNLAMGLPPHSDHGLLTLLLQNGVGGLQIQHQGKWINVDTTPPNSFLVNTGDHLEIISNRRYRSVVHRAIVNNKAKRISVAMAIGPNPEAVVGPFPELLLEGEPEKYRWLKYKDYVELQQSNKLDSKSCFDRVRK